MTSINDLNFQTRKQETGIKADDTVFASAARTTTSNSLDIASKGSKRVRLYLDITAASGTTPTLDLKVQAKDTLSGKYFDVAGASYVQKTTTGTDMLVLDSSITAVTNKAISEPLSTTYRVVSTIGGTTPSFTFSINAEYV